MSADEAAHRSTPDDESSPLFGRYIARRLRFLVALLIVGFLLGVAYRYFADAEHDFVNYVRSGVHGVGITFTAWIVQAFFASGARSRVGASLRRLPVAAEIGIRSLVMWAALVVVGVLLQAVLYAEPYGLHWASVDWFRTHLPSFAVMGIGFSLVVNAVTETVRLIGRPMLASVLLGTYHRPTRENLIVMFLDLAGSTRLAEEMGELKVHDLLTRFFFDIDEPISDFGGAVHAYVGDEVIVAWPLEKDPARNARALACFFAIERKIAQLAPVYQRVFGVAPRFRAGLHAGPVIVSECGDAKRQLALFGDTMNVAARLCEQCKAADLRLIVSADLLRQTKIPADMKVGESVILALRGRQRPIEAHAVEQSTALPTGA
jgi:class 3 adenylate cyclase